MEVDNYTVCLEDLSIEFGSEIGFNPENETLSILPVIDFVVPWNFKCYNFFGVKGGYHPERQFYFASLFEVFIVSRLIKHT